MPPRVTYWTGTWDPDKEAISKELEALRLTSSRRSIVVAFSPAHRTRIDRVHRAFVLSADRWLVLRALAAVLEPTGDVSHVFGGFSSWHLLRALGRRPIILTSVARRQSATSRLPGPIARVAVETDDMVSEWVEAGVPPEHIRVVYPGIDLSWYQSLPPRPGDRLQLLFASSPGTVAEFEERGVPLLVELARLRPDVDITVPWRQWGSMAAAGQALDALRPPANFRVHHEAVADMRSYFASADATITLFANGSGKACPNSILEGLACGRPAITTRECGIGALLDRCGAGVVCDRSVGAVSDAVDRLRETLPSLQARARETAERHFDLGRFRQVYERLYEEVAAAPNHRI